MKHTFKAEAAAVDKFVKACHERWPLADDFGGDSGSRREDGAVGNGSVA